MYTETHTPLIDKFVNEELIVSGIIVSEPIVKESYSRYVIQTDYLIHKNTKYLVEQNLLVYDDIFSGTNYGNIVRIEGKLGVPKNVYTENTLLYGIQFDWNTFLKKDAIFYEMFFPKITIEEENSQNFLIRSKQILLFFKKSFVHKLEEVIPRPESSLAAGEVLGIKNLLGDELEKKFRETGIIHVIVLSGYNVTIVADSIVKTLSFLSQSVAFYFGIFGIVLFAVLTGGGVPIVRASIMAILVLCARRYGRLYNITNSLFLTAFLMVFFDPMILAYDVSFQLSFLATLGLIYLAPHLEKKFVFITDKLSLRGVISATLATQLFVLPLLLYITGEISLVSVFVNMLILPIIPITMFFSFITGIAGFLSYALASGFGFISTLLLSYQLFIVDMFSRFSFASVDIPIWGIWIIVSLYIIVGVVFLYKKKENFYAK